MAVKKTFNPLVFLLPDLALMYLALYWTFLIRYGSGGHQLLPLHFKVFSAIFAVWLVILFINQVFDVSSLRRYSTLFFQLITGTVANFVAAAVYFYYQPNLILTPRRFLLIDVVLTFVLIALWHLFIKYVFANKAIEDIYLFSFTNELGELEAEISKHRYLGFRVLGHLNAETIKTAQLKNVSVILTDNVNAQPETLAKFYDLRKNGIVFYNSKDFYEILLRRVYLSRFNELWFLENIDYQQKRFYNIIKRVIDIFFGVVLFILFIISFPFVWLIQRIFSPGPVLFIQERVGKDGKVFRVYKYRTMNYGSQSSGWTSPQDPRIYKFGRFLRLSRLDELPQSINLLSGSMSLVGPRPEQVEIVAEMQKQIPFYDERHLVKPGLTGWAQLNVYASNLQETILKLQYDLYYIKNRSVLFDLGIILKTVYYVLAGKGR